MTIKHILLFTLIFSLLLVAPCTANTSPAPGDHTADSDQFIPPASGVISVSEKIDGTAPDKKTAEAFMRSEMGNIILNSLIDKDTLKIMPDEILSLTLKNFSYHTADGQVIIRNITASELFNSMNTTFTGHG